MTKPPTLRIIVAPSRKRRALDLFFFRAWRQWLRPLSILTAAIAGAHFAYRKRKMARATKAERTEDDVL